MINVSVNGLPVVGQIVPIYMTVILPDNSLSQVTITSVKTLYGNVTLMQPSFFTANDNSPIAILVTGTFDDVEYIGILYTKAIIGQVKPDNFSRLIQKVPQGVFNGFGSETIVGADFRARAKLIDDYYKQYFFVQNQVYSSNYSAELEFEYNATVGLLSTSVYPDFLFHWFSALQTVALNSYDLELAISQYIYFRIGVSCPVYINDQITSPVGYWILNDAVYSDLDTTTILAPDGYTPVLENLVWTIYNASTFTPEFELEVTNMIQRISRADIGNPVTFSPISNIVADAGFIYKGPTYFTDPRLLIGKCIQYTNNTDYPLNIIGYKAPAP